MFTNAAVADDCVNVGFTPTSGLFTGTLNLAGVTANKTGANGCDAESLVCLKLFFSDEEVAESCAGNVPGPALTANVTFDSLHYAHDTVVQLKAKYQYKKISDGSLVWSEYIVGPAIPVYNRNATWHDTQWYETSLVWSKSMSAWKYQEDYTASHSWTRDNYLAKITDRTANYVLAHGGTYLSGDGKILPPGGGGDITKLKVPPPIDQSILNGHPVLAFAILINCKAGANTALPNAFLHGSPSTINRFVLSFKVAVGPIEAAQMVYAITSRVTTGKAAYKAAKEAHDSVLWPINLTFTNRCNYVGDPAAKIKFVYDGDPDATSTAWKR